MNISVYPVTANELMSVQAVQMEAVREFNERCQFNFNCTDSFYDAVTLTRMAEVADFRGCHDTADKLRKAIR